MKLLRVLLAWLLVGIPLGWGVGRSVQRSLPLFGVRTAPTAAPMPAATVPAPPRTP